MTKVVPISAGVGTCFLVIQNDIFFLVDTGNKGYENKIAKAITSRGLKLTDLRFVFLTHTHYDHAGSASAIHSMTGAKIIVHKSETDFLQTGFHPMPKGTSGFYKVIATLGLIGEKKRTSFEGLLPDIVFDKDYSLSDFGFEAKILHTPGHTMGSSCLIIGKYAFVGDTLFNVFGNYYPPFGNEVDKFANSWEILRKMDVEYYYPTHGKRISKKEFEAFVSKRSK